MGIFYTYVDGRGAGQRKHPGRRRLFWHVPVELLIAEIPFNRVQRDPVEIVVAGQLQRFARPDGFGIPNADAFQTEYVCGKKQNFYCYNTVKYIRFESI